MTEIEEAEVQRFIIEKIRNGLAKKTVRDIVAVLRAVVKYGARLHLCEREDWQLDYPTTESGRKLPVLSLRHQRKIDETFDGTTQCEKHWSDARSMHGNAHRRGLCFEMGGC